MSLNDLRDKIHACAVAHEWWSKPTDTTAAKLLLIHSEISEATEILREAGPCPYGAPDVDWNDLRRVTYDSDGKPHGFPTELADVLIRVLDMCGRIGIDIEAVTQEKIAYNERRPMRHGGKAI